MGIVRVVLAFLRALMLGRTGLAAENLALRHQLAVLERSVKRPQLRKRDRILWVWLSRLWTGWRSALVLVQPATVIKWHRQGFKLYWRRKSRRKPGCPKVDRKVRELIRRISRENPTWGARRRVVHFNVTTNSTAQWTAQQTVEAFPFEEAPRFLLRDRDRIYGQSFRDRVEHMGIEEVRIAFRSPWQSPYVERLIGSIRHECLDHVIVFNEEHLRRLLTEYLGYHHEARAHLSLERNSPIPRTVCPPEQGELVAKAYLGGLHHCYTRAA